MSDAASSTSQRPAIGRAAFGSLRAEAEPWLHEAFIPPSVYPAIGGMQSVIVFGDTGSGKTALYNALSRQSTGPDGYPLRLVVRWIPRMSEDLPEGSAGTQIQVASIFDDCALAIAHHITEYPDRWWATPDTARSALIWFVQRHGQGNLAVRLAYLRGRTASGDAALDELIAREVPPTLNDDAYLIDVIAELTKALKALGLDGIWIVVDGLERYLDLSVQLVDVLASFVSALVLFERSQQISYKLFVPQQLEHALREKLADTRRRFVVKYLTWSVPELKAIVDARLALATDQPGFALENLCSVKLKDLLKVLQAVGATNPRGWLEQVQPFLDYYLLQSERQPINKKTWFTLRKQNPPPLIIDDQSRRVFVGHREIPPNLMVGKNYEVLRYLYEQGNRIVSTAELYFCAYRGLPSVPRSTTDAHYEAPKEYDGAMDTLIYRLRLAIEPDPKAPVLLITVRGRGVQLIVRW